MQKRSISLGLLALQGAALFLALFMGQPGEAKAAALNPTWPFTQVWERTDYPVALGAASRSWYWGPVPFAFLNEDYGGSPGGTRLVSYYDKSRMEISNPFGDSKSKWFVTNGLLVKEMISGQIQLGDYQFDKRSSAEVPVSGDRLEENPVSPTYANFRNLTDTTARSTSPIRATLDRFGRVDSNSSLASRYPETAPAYYNSDLGHNVPGVMWNFLNSQGLVSKEHRLVNDRIEDWVFSFGLPVTEAYWTRSKVAGVEKDVLVQLFERRVLTYTPSNSAAFQVEMGNVGLHYYNWRYDRYTTKPGASPLYNQPPVRLSIPTISVNTAIEYVGLKGDAMDVPALPQNVAWYRYGPSIGDIGNAVIAGHYDYYATGKAVFWDLGKLRIGDTIEVYSVLGTKFSFRVTDTKSYLDTQFPIETVFGNSSQRNLNLITCEGAFDPVSTNYNRRLVVFTTLVE